MSHAIDTLRHEHDAILAALGLLSNMTRRLGTASPPEVADLSALLGFFRGFADQCHHGKEEGLLFPTMAAAGVPDAGGPLSVMRTEHVEGRRWIASMSAALQPSLDIAAWRTAAAGYLALLEAHIRKENDVLFPMAERVLPPPRLASLHAAFEAYEKDVMPPGEHEALHALLKRLRATYAN